MAKNEAGGVEFWGSLGLVALLGLLAFAYFGIRSANEASVRQTQVEATNTPADQCRRMCAPRSVRALTHPSVWVGQVDCECESAPVDGGAQ